MKLEDPWACASSVLAGYASKLKVNPAEADMLVAAVAGRFFFLNLFILIFYLTYFLDFVCLSNKLHFILLKRYRLI